MNTNEHMTRTIPAAEVIPGQRIRWTERGTTRELTVAAVRPAGCTDPAVQFRNDAGCYEYTDPAVEVTVLAEGPQEPTWFGARAVAGEHLGVRASESPDYPWTVREADTGDLVAVTWAWLCERGPVTVLPETGWAVPTAPVAEVAAPEYIEQGDWPTDDRHLWDYEWIDSLEWTWTRDGEGDHPWTARPSWDKSGKSDTQATAPIDGPWTRGKRVTP